MAFQPNLLHTVGAFTVNWKAVKSCKCTKLELKAIAKILQGNGQAWLNEQYFAPKHNVPVVDQELLKLLIEPSLHILTLPWDHSSIMIKCFDLKRSWKRCIRQCHDKLKKLWLSHFLHSQHFFKIEQIFFNFFSNLLLDDLTVFCANRFYFENVCALDFCYDSAGFKSWNWICLSRDKKGKEFWLAEEKLENFFLWYFSRQSWV